MSFVVLLLIRKVLTRPSSSNKRDKNKSHFKIFKPRETTDKKGLDRFMSKKMTEKINFDVENRKSLESVLDVKKNSNLNKRFSIRPNTESRFKNAFAHDFGKPNSALPREMANKEKKMSLFIQKCSESVTSVRAILEIIVELTKCKSQENFLKILTIEAPKVINCDHIFYAFTNTGVVVDPDASVSENGSAVSTQAQFRIPRHNQEPVSFPISEAKVFKNASERNEIIMINRRNDPHLKIKPVEDMIGEEIRNVIVSPIEGNTNGVLISVNK
mmetsp:Transcript_12948/g.12938  ORF Transcript_12948/g.12938 Transcript_12948/m.12938 type:complete len:272 (-) Transcript_12948:588-1403(-)